MDDQLRQAMLRAARRDASDHPADLDAAIRDGSRRLVHRLVIVESISVLVAVLILSLVGTAAVAGTGRTDDTKPTAQVTGLYITPPAPTLADGGTVQLNATGTYSDGTRRRITRAVDWAIENPTVATIDAHGFLTATRPGSTSVTAIANGIQDSAQLTVTKPAAQLTGLYITPSAPTLTVGGTVQLNALGSYSDGTRLRITSPVDWAIENPALATIDAHGFLTAAHAGTTTVIATANGTQGTAQLTISQPAPDLTGISLTPSDSSVCYPGTVQLTATGSYSDGTTRPITSPLDWSTDNANVATVDGRGFVTVTEEQGTAHITATDGQFSSSAAITCSTLR